ncbi:sensor domain-containing diguanylate cyclase [Anaerostipes sp.]|uniref:sensor domain-containing diguanylate cyclase n=1 Tax=Anaerostipes sp. TaxID=1872530 RepID=UPI0025C52576|nr:sensor domain-containing diguanylate cyclase [Anaerostipes sp.]MBS7007653.1 diguanylate cyclase [Anaerostipes sp.]
MREKKRNRQLNTTVILLMVIALVTFFIFSFVQYYRKMDTKIVEQTRHDLRSTNDTAKASLQSLLKDNQNWLESLAVVCDVPDGSGEENWWDIVARFDSKGLKIGVADNKGNMYYSSHKRQNIAERKYYKDLMKDKKSISKVLVDEEEGTESIIIGVPLVRDGKVKGAICLEYSTVELGRMLNGEDLKGSGAVLVFSKKGRMVASYEGMERFSTMYDMLRTMEYDDETDLDVMEANVKQGKSGYLNYHNKEKLRMLYYEPAGISDWTICTLAVAESYEETLYSLKSETLFLMMKGTLITVLLFIFGLQFFKMHRSERLENTKDALTGSLNRKNFQKVLEKDLKGKKKYSACFFLDVDDFKGINDTFGHQKGDEILTGVADRLRRNLREKDVVSRYGGDEFTCLIYGIRDQKKIEEIAGRMLRAVTDENHVNISIGITLIQNGDTYEQVIGRADSALYEAKMRGKNQYVIL